MLKTFTKLRMKLGVGTEELGHLYSIRIKKSLRIAISKSSKLHTHTLLKTKCWFLKMDVRSLKETGRVQVSACWREALR